MALNPTATAAANAKLWKEHPELRGRQLSRKPEDAALREEWLKNYREAEVGGPLPPDAESEVEVKAPAASCPTKPAPPRRFLCIRSNVAATEAKGGPGLTAGHSMLSLHENGKVTTYGAWPDSHPAIQAAGLDDKNATDVRTNFRNDDISNYPYARC